MKGNHVQGWTILMVLLCVSCNPQVKTAVPPGVNFTDRGVLDVTVKFPGAGNYEGYNTTALTTDKVCNDKFIFGEQGTATCQAISGGTTSTADQVLAGTFFWDATGANVAGTMEARGASWDLTTAFPGSGLYTGISSALTAADVCNTRNILGSAGTAVCQSGSTVTPAGIAEVIAGKEYWDSTGTKRTGTMTDRGGAWDLTTAFPGSGYYSGINSAITAAEVCTTKNILGTAGTAVCNSTAGDLIASNAVRTDYATVDLTVQAQVEARVRATLSDEAAGNATYTANHNLVPNPKFDTDGEDDDSGIGISARNYLATVKGRPEKVCGLAGSIATRIADCDTQNLSKATWEGTKYGSGGESDWKLVTLYKAAAIAGDTCNTGMAGGCYEVWRDERTKLIWSDYLNNNGEGYNWFRAAGYSSIASTTAVTGKEGRANVGTDCTDSLGGAQVCQPATPISVCAAALSIANLNGIATYQNPDGTGGTYDEGPAKGNLSGATAYWRLPTHADWALAFANGIHRVLPNMTDGTAVFWTATSHSGNRHQAWIASQSGILYPSSRAQVFAVRCIGS